MIENQHIEFKQLWRDDYLKQICGFANASGGTLYIGMDDNGKVVGVQDAKKLLESLPNIILQTMGLVVEIELLSEEDKEYIAIKVEKSDNPISYHSKFYVRSGATLQELSGVPLQQFMLKKMKLSWENLICEHTSIEDIDREAIDYFLHFAIIAGRMPKGSAKDSTETILKNLDLMTDDGKLTNAAILLFGKNPQHRFINARFRLGRFGRSESDLMFQNEIGGNLIEMADEIIEVLRSKYLTTPIRYEGLHRIEDLEIPEAALRELIYNALVHRDYLGMDTTMKIYNDRIWLWNEGEMPKGYNTETMLKPHRSKPRNKLIATVFFRAGFIESWGRGWDKVCEELKRAKVQLPTIESYDEGTLVTIKRPVKQGVETTDRFQLLTPRQQKILLLIQDNPKITAIQLANAIPCSERTVKNALSDLQVKNIIKRSGSDKSGSWEFLTL